MRRTRARSAARPTTAPRRPTQPTFHPRDAIHDYDDPYLPHEHLQEDTVCTGCGAVYVRQRWTLDESRSHLLVSTGAARETICPACKKIADRYPQGIVTLRGDYWPAHRDDIMNLVRNEEKRGMATNPLERVMGIREEDGRLVIETTNEKLAQRIGRQVEKAHRGHLQYKWSEDNRLVRVEWERSA